MVEAQPSTPSLAALMGLALLGFGLGGIIVYVAIAVPLVVHFSFATAACGAALLARELSLSDELVRGVSVADLLVLALQCVRCLGCGMALLFSLPDISAHDIRIMWRGATVLAEPQPEKLEAQCVNIDDCDASAQGASEQSFLLAKRWLQRDDLRLGLREQLRLYGLYRRALGAALPIARSGPSWLARAQEEAEEACADLSPGLARAGLAVAVADADPLFALAHPDLVLPRAGDQWGALLCLVERRLPHDLGDRVAAAQRRAFLASAALAVAAALRVLWLRVRERRSRAWLAAALLGAAGSAYAAALVRGVPTELHVAAARLLGARAKDGERLSERFWQYSGMLLAPRPSRSLFLQ